MRIDPPPVVSEQLHIFKLNLKRELARQRKSYKNLAEHLDYTQTGLTLAIKYGTLNLHLLIKTSEFLNVPIYKLIK